MANARLFATLRLGMRQLSRFLRMGMAFGPIVMAVWLGLPSSVQAQFGLRCEAPDFAAALNESAFTPEIREAIRATCAFNKKNAEMGATYKAGWPWDLLPKARTDVEELRRLADTAAELNFKTNDLRALGNIRRMYIRVGDQLRWLHMEEAKYERIKQKSTSPAPAPQGNTDQSAAAPTFVFVVFQDDVSSADKDAFLQAYSAAIAEGPDQNQVYKLRIDATLATDQLQIVINSMNTQTKVIKSAFVR